VTVKVARLGRGFNTYASYLLNHWQKLTLFLEKPGVPLDNNIVERALKKAILHRKNSLFYKIRKGAQMGDLFMSLIHTCELNDVNVFAYLTELLRHVEELKQNPSEWMLWNYRDMLARLAAPAAAA
jgi:transposase